MIIITCLTFLLFTIITSTAAFSSANDKFKIIQTEYGAIRGKLMATMYDNKPYYSFRGIPFARPPLRELRFKPPIPPVPWSNVLDAFEYGNECLQIRFTTEEITGSEDCLYLNVYTPAKIVSKKLPVMVWFHCGGFFGGSSNVYSPDFLLNSNDVIIVTTNYRIGAFGFLSLGTANYSGNMSLKDQLLALQWVQRNIKQFGGDKNLVTIFGESSGSASVHFHILSPKSDGLFKRAIMQSGSATNPWALYTKSDHLDIVYDLAKHFGNDPQGIEDLIKFLHQVDGSALIDVTNSEFYAVDSPRKDVQLFWVPIAEVDVANDPFLTKHPQEYLDDRSVNRSIDSLIGFCADEVIMFTGREIFNPTIIKLFNDKLDFDFPRTDLHNNLNSKENKNMTKEVLDYYFAETNGQITNESAMRFNDLISDIWFIYGVDQSVKSLTKQTTGNVFYYKFSLKSNFGMVNSQFFFVPPENFSATSHVDDLFYLWSFDLGMGTDLYENLCENSIERKLIKMMTKLWTDFAIYGHPTPNASPIVFKPVQKHSINYVDITNDGLIGGVKPFADRIKFWDKFYDKYEDILRSSSTVKNVIQMY